MAFKSALGIITLGMVTALYFKIRIIFNRSGSDQWLYYSRWVYLAIFLSIISNFVVAAYYTGIFAKNYQTYVQGDRINILRENFFDYIYDHLQSMGIFFASFYLAMTIVYIVVLVYLFKLIGNPELSGFTDFKE
jgi:hypothetical protein